MIVKKQATSIGRRKNNASKSAVANELRKSSAVTRRKNSPKVRKRSEKRQDMQIIISASQGDIYVWAVSLAIMSIILAVIITLAFVKGV